MMWSTAAKASIFERHTITPLPAARPSALTTMGAPLAWMYSLAASGSSKRANSAVGIPYLAHRSFMNPLDPSSTAALALGPKALMPAASRRSTRPATRGVSGPTTTRSIARRTASATTPSRSSAATGTHSATSAIPALPGVQ